MWIGAQLLQDGDFVITSRRAQVEGALAVVAGRTRVVVAPMSPRRTNFAIARMLARRELRGLSSWTEERERELAAFLVAPSPSVRAAYAELGLNITMVAQRFAVTETCAAMRVVEVGAADGLVVTPSRVYRPGTLLSWAPDEDARAIARRAAPRSVRKVALRDEPDRVALYRLRASA